MQSSFVIAHFLCHPSLHYTEPYTWWWGGQHHQSASLFFSFFLSVIYPFTATTPTLHNHTHTLFIIHLWSNMFFDSLIYRCYYSYSLRFFMRRSPYPFDWKPLCVAGRVLLSSVNRGGCWFHCCPSPRTLTHTHAPHSPHRQTNCIYLLLYPCSTFDRL